MSTTYKKLTYDNNPTMVDVAEKDSAGNVIKDTYAKKSSVLNYYHHNILLETSNGYIATIGTSSKVSVAISFDFINTKNTAYNETTLLAYFANMQPTYAVSGYIWGTVSYKGQLIPCDIYFNTTEKKYIISGYRVAYTTEPDDNLFGIVVPYDDHTITDSLNVIK